MSLTEISVAEAQRTVDGLLGDRYRVEVVDGALAVTPSPDLPHSRMVGELYVWLRERAPEPLEVLIELDVSADLTGAEREPYWRPDLVVATPSDPGARWLLADEVELAVEVVSPSNTAQAGTAENYLRQRAEHGARHGLRCLLGVDGDRVSWWHDGQPVAVGPDWAPGLRLEAGRVVDQP